MSVEDIGEIWKTLWNDLEAECEKITGFTADETDKNIFMTGKFPPTVFPSIFIQPMEVRPGEYDTSETEMYFTFNIYVFDSDPDPKTAMDSCMDIAGDVRSQIIDDRVLGGDADNVEDIRYIVNPPIVPSGYERQCIAVVITIRRQIA